MNRTAYTTSGDRISSARGSKGIVVMTVETYLRNAADVINRTADVLVDGRVEQAIQAITTALSANKAMLVCGNGGSASDAMHITGELVGRFLQERRALKCICLASNASVLTAWGNDYEFETVFSRQVEAYGEPGGVLLGISTSGNSMNVLNALAKARELKMTTIGLTGEGGGKMAALCDVLIDVPSRATPETQQVHLCIYHHMCAEIEKRSCI